MGYKMCNLNYCKDKTKNLYQIKNKLEMKKVSTKKNLKSLYRTIMIIKMKGRTKAITK